MTTQHMLFVAALEGGMTDFARLINLCHLVFQTESVPGVVCEFGTYRGQTAALMASLTKREVWLYDSFEGLSEPGPHDKNVDPYKQGAMRSRPETVLQTFEAAGLKEPKIIKEDVRNLNVSHLPQGISLAHIDLDLAEPTLAVLELIWNFVSAEQGTVVIDDYKHPELPGIKHAVDEFCSRRSHDVWVIHLPGDSMHVCLVKR